MPYINLFDYFRCKYYLCNSTCTKDLFLLKLLNYIGPVAYRGGAEGASRLWRPLRRGGKEKNVKIYVKIGQIHVKEGDPVSTGILPHSLPERAFRARPGLWRNYLCTKVARIAEHKFGSR